MAKTASGENIPPSAFRTCPGAVNGMMLQVIQGHLTDHVVKEPDEKQREADLETVMQVIKSYLK